MNQPTRYVKCREPHDPREKKHNKQDQKHRSSPFNSLTLASTYWTKHSLQQTLRFGDSFASWNLHRHSRRWPFLLLLVSLAGTEDQQRQVLARERRQN